MPENMVTTPDEVRDEALEDEVIPDVAYDVTSYGSDPDVDGLVRRIGKGDIQIPPFQRGYVWTQREASRFVESLLLGLPVPGIFLANDAETNKMLVLDGQQRLRSLQFFIDGYFNPKEGDARRKVFSLQKVQKRFEGKTFEDLEEKDRLRLENSVIHATIVKQSSPPGDDTSVYHIFERLNSGGRRLTHQEIRVALYNGGFMDMLKKTNEHEGWRRVFGNVSNRLKDQEMILRFLALYYEREKYGRPMSEFLSKFCGRHRKDTPERLEQMSKLFRDVIDLFSDAMGKEAFRPTRALNVAVFDSCMVGLANRIESSSVPSKAKIRSAYSSLVSDESYLEAVSRSTADESFISRRIDKAKVAFA